MSKASEPQRRKLIVPKGHGAWLAIDPSTTKVAVASIASDGRRGVSEVIAQSHEGGQRLWSLYRLTRALVRDVIESVGAPGVIVVEQPSGARPNPQLSYATGAIMAGAFDGAFKATGRSVLVETVPSGTWKKVACGNGSIRKPLDRELGKPYAVLEWARDRGYDGTSWDSADAMAIAEYARQTFTLVER